MRAARLLPLASLALPLALPLALALASFSAAEAHAQAPTQEAQPEPLFAGLRPQLLIDGEMAMQAQMPVAGGLTLGLQLQGQDGWAGGVSLSYRAGEGQAFGEERAEVGLGLEAVRDFGPADDLGFRLRLGLGLAHVFADAENDCAPPGGVRLTGRFGVEARISPFDERVGLLMGIHGLLSVRPEEGLGPKAGSPVDGGGLITMGLLIDL